MLLSNLDLLATAPGGVAKLRELILTLAVQGRLVPQDPADEPAGVLLQKIRAEKDRLIAEGKMKRDKPLAPITDEEKPFVLPRGWEWAPLGEVGIVGSSSRVHQSDWQSIGVPFYRAREIVKLSKDGQVQNDLFISEELFTSLAKGGWVPEVNDIMITGVGTIGVPYAVRSNDRFYFKDASVLIFKNYGGLDPKYLCLFMQSPLWIDCIHEHSMGTTVDTLTITRASATPIPIPPIAEQSRIAARVESLMRLCDVLEAKGQLEATQHAQLVSTLLGALTASITPEELVDNWQRVAQHFDLLMDRPEAIDALEQTLLQLAVRGLLEPQDPTDEPASALLERIRAEKDRLISEGKIKRGKPLPPITEEKKAFEVPVGWEWSTLAVVGIISPRNKVEDDALASFVEMRSIPILFGEKHASESRLWRDIKSGFTHFAEGDVGLAKITPCFENGKSTVFQDLSNGVGAGTTELHVVRPLCGLHPQYVLLFLKSPAFLREGESVMTGSAGQKRLPRTYFESTPFPLPPLAEQSRIVARVTTLRRLCADLRQRLAEGQSVQARLADALVETV